MSGMQHYASPRANVMMRIQHVVRLDTNMHLGLTKEAVDEIASDKMCFDLEI